MDCFTSNDLNQESLFTDMFLLDTSTNKKVGDDINVGNKPFDMALDPFGGSLTSLVFVANAGSDTVSVIDGVSNRVLTNMIGFHQPECVLVNPLYVANSANNTVSVVDYIISVPLPGKSLVPIPAELLIASEWIIFHTAGKYSELSKEALCSCSLCKSCRTTVFGQTPHYSLNFIWAITFANQLR
jgi:YVTN family beta-propeller protein